MLKTWQKIFPSTVKPMSEISGELMSHVRYPADLFKVQREILGQYHVTDAGSFYSSDDSWIDAERPAVLDQRDPTLQPPYYLTMQMPGQDDPSFSLYSTFIPTRGAPPAEACSPATSPSTRMPATRPANPPRATASCACSTLPRERHRARPRPGAEQLRRRPGGLQRS